ncbi:hypothetical protein J4Q44_G00102010 [Coregonus suidteri]|uniref:Myosin N-terminal SH3-like domain-containing protein n=1 Tax=Coregonus suidteri TaxID=861788 RepID=A0AAN8LV06_9TELE
MVKREHGVPDEKEAYIEVEIKELDRDNVIVETKDRRSLTVKEEDIQQINNLKFDMIEDMAMLTLLNKASVLCNLAGATPPGLSTPTLSCSV